MLLKNGKNNYHQREFIIDVGHSLKSKLATCAGDHGTVTGPDVSALRSSLYMRPDATRLVTAKMKMFVGYCQTSQVNSNQRDLVVEKLRTFCIELTIGIYQNFMYITTKHPTTTANQNPIRFHQGYLRFSSASGSFSICGFHIVAESLSASTGLV